MNINRCAALAVWLFAIAGIAKPATAQVEQDREEATVESFGLTPEEERENIIEEARQGPQTSATVLESQIDIEEIERTEAALSRLRSLVEDTPRSDVTRAEYMFRLAELYYNRARYYEQRAYRRRDQAYELREINPQRSRAYEENAAADLDQSDVFASEAINLYADIYQDYGDTYDGIDAVLYYLGANMLQLGENEGARQVFEQLALDHPQSPYMPQAFLMLGELMFIEGDMEMAQMYYSAVIDSVGENPAEGAYAYALYKLAWCQYNLSESLDDYELAVQMLFDSIVATEVGDEPSRVRMRRDALRDMTLFYSEVYPADLALDFFEEIAPEESFDLVFRLARIYGDRGQYEDSNTLYRALIMLNTLSFDIVDYQREIVRNTRPQANDVEIVREMRRLVEVYELAQQYDDAEPERVRRVGGQIEELLRQLATTYHAEGQTTLNEQYYALAFALYEDYIDAFPESRNAYTMWFYFAELLYRNEQWLSAADAYEHALGLSSPEHNQFDQEGTYAACLSYTKMVDLAASVQGTGASTAEEDELPPVPVARPIPDEYSRMMTACDRFLATAPEPGVATEIEGAIAYVYYEYDHLDEAVLRFGEIALNRVEYDAARGRAAAELLLDSLALQREFGQMKDWIDRFKDTPQLNTGSFAERLRVLSEQVDFRQCLEMNNRNDYEDAGHCFIAFVENHFESELMCRGLYNAGFAFDQADKLDFSISAMNYLAEFCPETDFAAETIYQLGRSFHRMNMFDDAAAQYESYYEAAPDGDNAENALNNAATFRQGLGQYSQAVDALQAYIDATDDAGAVAEARFQIAEIERAREREDDAIEAYERVADRHADDSPSRALQAHAIIAEMYIEAGSRNAQERAAARYDEVLDLFWEMEPEDRARLTPEGRDAAARAQFQLGENIFREFESIPLEGDEAEVQDAIREKLLLGNQARLYFVGSNPGETEQENWRELSSNWNGHSVIEIGRPGWSIAAFTRVGQLYHVFYEQIIDSPIPEGLTALEEEAYQTAIENQAADLKAQAATFYAEAINIARQTGWFNDYSELAAELLTELDPTFKAGSEIRIAPGSDIEVGPSQSGLALPDAFDWPDDSPSAPPASDGPAERPTPTPPPTEAGQ
jgi:TolA-binding protein